jgi:hypothetical protein
VLVVFRNFKVMMMMMIDALLLIISSLIILMIASSNANDSSRSSSSNINNNVSIGLNDGNSSSGGGAVIYSARQVKNLISGVQLATRKRGGGGVRDYVSSVIGEGIGDCSSRTNNTTTTTSSPSSEGNDNNAGQHCIWKASSQVRSVVYKYMEIERKDFR